MLVVSAAIILLCICIILHLVENSTTINIYYASRRLYSFFTSDLTHLIFHYHFDAFILSQWNVQSIILHGLQHATFKQQWKLRTEKYSFFDSFNSLLFLYVLMFAMNISLFLHSNKFHVVFFPFIKRRKTNGRISLRLYNKHVASSAILTFWRNK